MEELTDVRYEVEDGLAWITIDRTDRLNAFRARSAGMCLLPPHGPSTSASIACGIFGPAIPAGTNSRPRFVCARKPSCVRRCGSARSPCC